MSNNTQKNLSPHSQFKGIADDVVSLTILRIIEQDPNVSQNLIRSSTGIAAGLVHSYMHRVINKGWVKAKQVSPKRWLYYVTREGFIEKSRLTVKFLSRTFRDYQAAHRLVQSHLQECLDNGWSRLIVAGSNELAEVTALNIDATDELELVTLVDDNASGSRIGGVTVLPFESIGDLEYDRILVCDSIFLKWWHTAGNAEDGGTLIHVVNEPI